MAGMGAGTHPAQDLCAAAIRAMAGESGVHFRGGLLHRGDDRLAMPAPHLHPPEGALLGAVRGAADGMALRLIHSDAAEHSRRSPGTVAARLIFDMLEQFRVESLAAAELAGQRANLARRFRDWSNEFEASGLCETQLGLLLFTTAQMCHAKVLGTRMPDHVADVVEATRFHLGEQISTDVAALRSSRFRQADFACHALAVAERVAALCAEAASQGTSAAPARARGGDFQLVFDQEDLAEAPPIAGCGRSPALSAGDGGYRVFSTIFDQVCPASDLVRPDVLARLRSGLDDLVAQQRINVPRLARALKLLLSVPVADGWQSDVEEGRVDGSRLARLVTSSTERRVFRTDQIEASTTAAVTFLLDCSGSMKAHSESLSVLVDIFVRALDMADVRTEVLGFTTVGWNGGRLAKAWQRAGQPVNPGRLNEVRHLVFKDSHTSWRRSRQGIAALGKPELYREGIDGEAVEWACSRLAGEDGRRVLFVVSDGSPMDSATARSNDEHYLEHHLRDVVAGQERSGVVEIVGLGVGLDLSPYYRRSAALDLSQGTTSVLLQQVLELLARRR